MADGTSKPAVLELKDFSPLQRERLAYAPELPAALAAPAACALLPAEPTVHRSAADEAALRSWFPRTSGLPLFNVTAAAAGGAAAVALPATPLRVGVVFAGRQSPGGHSVVCGLHDFLHARGGASGGSVLLGFVSGTKGLFDQQCVEITAESLATYRNQGGFHMLGRSIDRVRSAREQEAALAACTALRLDGLVVLGGTYSNTDAAHLAEFFASRGSSCRVVGVPVTIDNDVHNNFVEATVGFDSATKVYAQLVGNMATDGNSAKKYWYFVKLMGRSVSRVCLEVALQTHPNAVVLGEDIEARKLTLIDLVRETADVVTARAAKGKNFGIVLIPEGVISYIPELRTLIGEINQHFAEGVDAAALPAKLTPWSQALLQFLPALIRQQLFLERESSGAVQLSQINTERLLAELVGDELSRRRAAGRYAGKYATICSSFGYQARCSLPSNFDCCYGTALGATAAALVAGGHGGYMATVRNLAGAPASWEPVGVPLASMMVVPVPGSALAQAGAAAATAAAAAAGTASGLRPVIPSAPVDVLGGAFLSLQASAAAWAESELYSNPGPIQFRGATADARAATLELERSGHMARIGLLRGRLDAVRTLCGPGCSEALLSTAFSSIASLHEILAGIKARESAR